MRCLRLEKYPQYGLFPYEGAILYRNRHKELAEEKENDTTVAGLLEELADLLEKAENFLGKPDHYLAVLRADGDHMGTKISQLATGPKGLESHRSFSERLAGFASVAKSVVVDKGGCLVYSGGGRRARAGAPRSVSGCVRMSFRRSSERS